MVVDYTHAQETPLWILGYWTRRRKRRRRKSRQSLTGVQKDVQKGRGKHDEKEIHTCLTYYCLKSRR